MLQAIVISNQIEGIEKYYRSNEQVSYTIYPITDTFAPELSPYDLMIVPNGSDHIAMQKIRHRVQDFLEQGKALLCCDGWFTDWIPGNRWQMDNHQKSIDTRYVVKNDPRGFFDGLDIDEFIFSHGISGYWACGYIQPAAGAVVLLEDTWHRPIVVMDEVTTRGLILLTASGPLADARYDASLAIQKESALSALYHRWIAYIIERKKFQYATNRSGF